MIASMRLPASIAGSSRNVSSGVYFRRTWRPSDGAQVRRGCLEGSLRRHALLRLEFRHDPRTPLVRSPERGIVDGRLSEIGGHVDAGDGDQPEARVGQALELVADRLAHHLVDPRHRAGTGGAACGWSRVDLQPRGLDGEQLDDGRVRPRSARPPSSTSAPGRRSRRRPPPRSPPAATGPGGRSRPPTPGTGGAARRRWGGSRPASP